MNLAIDPQTGLPRWSTGEGDRKPKEDFALEAAKRLATGKLTLAQLEHQMIKAGNVAWKAKGGIGEFSTLKQVKGVLGGSANEWFHEIKRVASDPEALAKLLSHEGRGLTALARSVEPLQVQRRKGFASAKADASIRELIDTLARLKKEAADDPQLSKALRREAKSDVAKYRALRRASKQ